MSAEQQIGPLVSGEAPREAEGQNVGIEHIVGLGDDLGREAAPTQMAFQPRGARCRTKCLAGRAAQRPERLVRERFDQAAQFVGHAAPAILAAGSGPDLVGLARIP